MRTGTHTYAESEGPRSDTEAALEAGMALQGAQVVQPSATELLSVVVPAEGRHELVDLEQYLDAPRAAAGVTTHETVQSLVRYVERHDVADATTLWVDGADREVVAVLDDHEGTGGSPRWRRHRANLALQHTPEWRHWIAKDGRRMSQVEFAEHIEDGVEDVVVPDGATMLEIAQSIQGKRSAEFKGAQRLSTGLVGIEYVETQTAKAGQQGDLEIPERFELGIAPFVGEDAFRVVARLRWRVEGGSITLGYKLERPEAVLDAAVDGIVDRLGQQFGLDRVFRGSPRA